MKGRKEGRQVSRKKGVEGKDERKEWREGRM